jgi:hypothetical protein
LSNSKNIYTTLAPELEVRPLEKVSLMKDRQTERSITRSHIVKADYLNGASDEQLTTREFIRIF